jgi:hypothetical protein
MLFHLKVPKQGCTDNIQKLAHSSDDKKLHVETKDNSLFLDNHYQQELVEDFKICNRCQRAIKPPEFCGGR